ncbi:MAG: hypothetical protein WCK27_16235 [Verrucomicrobiota bacterium]
MKHLTIVLTLLGMAACIIVAESPSYVPLRPVISLPEAFPLAARALGSDTNRFYCLQALWGTNDAPNGKWLFVFVSTNGESKRVTVFSDRKTRVAPTMVLPGGR